MQWHLRCLATRCAPCHAAVCVARFARFLTALRSVQNDKARVIRPVMMRYDDGYAKGGSRTAPTGIAPYTGIFANFRGSADRTFYAMRYAFRHKVVLASSESIGHRDQSFFDHPFG